jgi:hypothetical protein
MQKSQCGAKTYHLLNTFYYHFNTFFHTFLTPKIPQNPKWVAGTLGRLPELDFLIFFDALFMVDSINQKLFGVVYFIAF